MNTPIPMLRTARFPRPSAHSIVFLTLSLKVAQTRGRMPPTSQTFISRRRLWQQVAAAPVQWASGSQATTLTTHILVKDTLIPPLLTPRLRRSLSRHLRQLKPIRAPSRVIGVTRIQQVDHSQSSDRRPLPISPRSSRPPSRLPL